VTSGAVLLGLRALLSAKFWRKVTYCNKVRAPIPLN
jgi:hypothetical protein